MRKILRKIGVGALAFGIGATSVLLLDGSALYSADSESKISVYEDNGKIVARLDGIIDTATPKEFLKVFREHDVDVVELHSNGGHAIAAIQLGELFHENPEVQFRVRQYDWCMSACSYALIGANDIDIQGLSGIHYAYVISVSTGISISRMIEANNNLIVEFNDYLDKHGFQNNAYIETLEHSGQSTYIAFRSNEDLNNAKVSVDWTDLPKVHSSEVSILALQRMVKIEKAFNEYIRSSLIAEY